MARPLLIVGDVQGDSERLEEALTPYPEDEVDSLFLGDFFQGGRPGAAGGYHAAALARARRNSRSIIGNHDLFLLCVLEERRTGETPQRVRDAGRESLASVWLGRRGDWADLDAVDADPAMEAWLRALPLMLRLEDGTLVQHCDDDAYAQLGDDVDAVNRRGRELLAEPGGAWTLLWHTVGRRAFDDEARLERHLARFGATRLVHGHTPHHGTRPVATHAGRLWSFDGCFSRYWSADGADFGPIEATVALLPELATN
ncbi:MAG TPA: metallophosphoesterase [Candidatus Dormibacteraeota bacterium]